MADLNFAQTSRRNFALPVLISLLVLGLIGTGIYFHFAGRTVAASVVRTEVFPVRATYTVEPRQAHGFKVLNSAPASHDEGVYVLVTVHVDNHLDGPIFLKDFHATVDTPGGQVRASAIEKDDLAAVKAAFPELAPKMAMPLLRETPVAPGQGVEGVVILQLPLLEPAWKARNAATLTIDLYHQPSIVVSIPN